MTDTMQAPVLPPAPPAGPRRNPALTALTTLAILAVVALGIVAVIAVADRDNGTTMMGTNGMPSSMMNGSMMGHGTSSPTIPGGREIAVTATAFKFDPTEIHVRAGEDITIVLTASDSVHDFTIDELAFHVAASPGQQGRGSFHAPATAGRYTAYCSVAGHRQAGMTVTVVIDTA
jgi:heme/copper-type cytochrome/quinol oxidase subunit 2